MHKFAMIISLVFLTVHSGFAQKDPDDQIIPKEIVDPGSAQIQAIPAICILPEDVAQNSIRQIGSSDHRLGVRWEYTEVGANKMLAFWEAHAGQTVQTVVGSFKDTVVIGPFRPLPGCANYSEWKQGWLKSRTDKFYSVSNDDAKKIIAGLKAQQQ
jgi:hypothetical protein